MSDYRALHQYADSNAASYDARRFRALKGRVVDRLEWRLLERAITDLVAHVGPLPRVVDVPVGTGRMARRIRAKGCYVVGVDASPDMLALARAQDSADEYATARVEELSRAVPEVDCIVSVRLFGHLPADAKGSALREFSKVATKGAVVFFAGDTAWLRLRRAVQGRLGRQLESWSPLTAAEARKLAEACGFVVLGVRSLGPLSETRALILAIRDAARPAPAGSANAGHRRGSASSRGAVS